MQTVYMRLLNMIPFSNVGPETAPIRETDRDEIGQRVKFPGIAEPYKTGDLGEGDLYSPGLNLTVSKIWTETGRPFMM